MKNKYVILSSFLILLTAFMVSCDIEDKIEPVDIEESATESYLTSADGDETNPYAGDIDEATTCVEEITTECHNSEATEEKSEYNTKPIDTSDISEDVYIEPTPTFIVFENIEEYRAYISEGDLLPEFITYEMLADVGDFKNLTLRDNDCYHYGLVDKRGADIMVSMEKLDAGESLVNKYMEKNVTSIQGAYPDSFTYNKDYCLKGILFNDIIYYYNDEGFLDWVAIIVGNYRMTVSCYEDGFADYRSERDNVLTCILSGNKENVDMATFFENAVDDNESEDKASNTVSAELVESLEEGVTYDSVLKILGEENYIINGSHFWKTEDGRIARLDFYSEDNSESKILSNEAYIFTKTKTGITRVTDADEISRAEIYYMGIKSSTIDISGDSDAIAALVEYIKNANGEFVNSTRGYSGVPYSVTFSNADGEDFQFEIWSESSYSTNEYKDGNYNMFAYGDISELYQYLCEKYDEHRFRAEEVEVGMTFGEVKKLMGEEGTDIGSGVILYQWELSDGKKLLVWLDMILGEAPSSIDEYVVSRVEIQ